MIFFYIKNGILCELIRIASVRREARRLCELIRIASVLVMFTFLIIMPKNLLTYEILEK